MNPSKFCDLGLFYVLRIFECLFFKISLKLQWMMPPYCPLGEYVQEGSVLLIFVILLLLIATNIVVNFVPPNKRG